MAIIRPSRPKPTELKRIGKIKPNAEIAWRLRALKDKSWGDRGSNYRFNSVFKIFLKAKPLDHILGLKKPKPEILFLGPGEGDYISLFVNELQITNPRILPKVDVFGLTPTLSDEAKKVVRTDFSKGKALEEIITNPDENKDFINHVSGRYDLIMADMSVGFHTDYPEHNLAYSALMLNKGGKLYFDFDASRIRELLPDFNSRSIKFSRFRYEYIKRFVERFALFYNRKYETNLKFDVNLIPPNYIEVTRIS